MPRCSRRGKSAGNSWARPGTTSIIDGTAGEEVRMQVLDLVACGVAIARHQVGEETPRGRLGDGGGHVGKIRVGGHDGHQPTTVERACGQGDRGRPASPCDAPPMIVVEDAGGYRSIALSRARLTSRSVRETSVHAGSPSPPTCVESGTTTARP